MVKDSLRQRVLAYDRERNTPRQMNVTTRDVEAKHICLACRRVPDEWAMRRDWYQQNRDDWGYQKTPWPGVGSACLACGGQLIEVTW